MKFTYFRIHPGKNPPQNGCRLKFVIFFKSTSFTSSTFPIQPDFSQNQPAAITLNTGSPRTWECASHLSNIKAYTIHIILFLVNPTLNLLLKVPNWSSLRHLRRTGNKSIWDQVYMLDGWDIRLYIYDNLLHIRPSVDVNIRTLISKIESRSCQLPYRFDLGPVHTGSQIPSLTRVIKCQHGGKIPNLWASSNH
jgi:hypothetical protein